jgi:hypothetical protein
MKLPRGIPSLSREELLVLVAEQQRQISKLQGQLVKAVERLTREKQRAASPAIAGGLPHVVRRPNGPERCR